MMISFHTESVARQARFVALATDKAGFGMYPSGEDRGMSQRCRGGGCQAASLARSLFQFQGRS